MSETHNPLNTRDTLTTAGGDVVIYRLDKLESDGVGPVSKLPFSIKVLLEAALRNLDEEGLVLVGTKVMPGDILGAIRAAAIADDDFHVALLPA